MRPILPANGSSFCCVSVQEKISDPRRYYIYHTYRRDLAVTFLPATLN